MSELDRLLEREHVLMQKPDLTGAGAEFEATCSRFTELVDSIKQLGNEIHQIQISEIAKHKL